MSPEVRRLRVVTILVALSAMAGCASIPPDLGRADVDALTAQRGVPLPPHDARTRGLVDEVLAEPLSPQAAVRVALLQNPRLRIAYAELGFAAADIYEAGRLSNPGFSVGAMESSAGGTQLTFGLAQSFTDLITLPARSRLAKAEFESVKRAVGSDVFNLTADVEAAYYDLAGAEQIATMRAAIAEAARAAAELADRFHAAGNINRLELALERAAASEARLDLAEARSAVTAARATLGQLLGVSAETNWTLAPGLPVPVAEEDDVASLVSLAFESRLDLDAARRDVERLADSLGVTRSYRWLGEIELGVEREREPGGERLTGPSVSLELPIFNQHADAVTRAEASLAIAEAELRELHLGAGRDVRRAYADVLTARERIEEHRRTLIPLREEIVQRTQEQVNFMLMGVFELLRAKEQEYDAYESYLEAVRDYWLARVELKRAVGTALPSDSDVTHEHIDARLLTGPKSGAGKSGEHAGHHGNAEADTAMPMDHSAHGAHGEDAAPEPQSHHGEDHGQADQGEHHAQHGDKSSRRDHEPQAVQNEAQPHHGHHGMQGDDAASDATGNGAETPVQDDGEGDDRAQSPQHEHHTAPPAGNDGAHQHHGSAS